MTIRATCNHCGKDFYFLQLYRAAPEDGDRCPNCSTRLGILNLRRSAVVADAALADLTAALQAVAERAPGFTIIESTVLDPLERALRRDDVPVAENPRRRHRRRLARRREAA